MFSCLVPEVYTGMRLRQVEAPRQVPGVTVSVTFMCVDTIVSIAPPRAGAFQYTIRRRKFHVHVLIVLSIVLLL
jgi:hypothetical protein